MEIVSGIRWDEALVDPSGRRSAKPRTSGLTMVIDKGLGMRAFEDFIETAGQYVDMIKMGFGTAALYPMNVLQRKIATAKNAGIRVFPGGTFMEVAIAKGESESYVQTVKRLGFTGIEISDGTIDIERSLRNELIERCLDEQLAVFTEYGKKAWGSKIERDELVRTVQVDLNCGASLVTVEGRESGKGVGIYDEDGECNDEEIMSVLQELSDPTKLLWETPLKQQQVHLIQMLGAGVNLGNIAPEDVMALEALRRGLRSDTFIDVK